MVDKTDLTPRLEAIETRSRASAAKPFDRAKEFELFLALILIGTGRHRRGETLIAGQFIRSYALRNLLGLIRDAHAPVPAPPASPRACSWRLSPARWIWWTPLIT